MPANRQIKGARKSAKSTSATRSTFHKSTSPLTKRRKHSETRAQLLERLTNPQITLREASILLDVCTATVRNYSNSGLLEHERTPGGQRRFRLKTVMALCRERDAARKKKR